MNNRWPPMLGVVGFDGGHKPAIALSIPRRRPTAGEEGAGGGGEGTGACCYDDGTCDSPITQFDCTSAGGTYQGDGTDCDSVTCTGVCCEPGCLDDSTPDSCASDGGTFQGFGTTCADDPPPCPTGACCDDMGGCTITSEEGCTGTYQGDGTVCDPNPCMPSCDGCGFVNPGDGLTYLTKTVVFSGSGTCTGGASGSGTATTTLTVDPAISCTPVESCGGSGDLINVLIIGDYHVDWQFRPASGHCEWHNATDGYLTDDPTFPIRCFAMSNASCPGPLWAASVDCSGHQSDGSGSSADWTITVTYSNPCTPSGFVPPP